MLSLRRVSLGGAEFAPPGDFCKAPAPTTSEGDDMAQAKVTGPVEGGKGRPFAGPPDDQVPATYVIEEFLLQGTACSYRPTAEAGVDGRWSVEPDEEADYVSRMYVARPRDASDFN